MEEILNTFKKINFQKILIIYILIQPIIDMLTSLCVRYVSSYLTLGIFIRSIFLVFILIYAFAVANKKWSKIIFVYCLILFLYIVLFFANNIFNIGFSSIIFQFKSIIKSFYFSILLVAFIPIINETNINNKYLVYSLLGYTSIISITTFLGIGFNSYANGSGHGKNGLFYAANEIGTILCVLMPFLLLTLIDSKSVKNNKQILFENMVFFITLIFTIISSLWMGTKVPFLGLILVLLVSFVACLINIIKKNYIKNYLLKLLSIILLFLIIFCTIGYSPIGKNLGVSINKIIKISQSNTDKNLTTPENTLTDDIPVQEEFESVILSSRDVYYDNTLAKYKNSSIISKFLGIGYITTENGKISERKTVEIDYFDIVFSNGIVGSIIFFIPLLGLLLYVAMLLWKKKTALFENNTIFYIYSVFIALVIARLAGHVLSAPAVSFYLVLAINQLIKFLKD